MDRLSYYLRSGALLAGLAVPLVASAQKAGSWVFTPYAGVYLPTTDVGRLSATAGGSSASVAIRHDNALALGATANYWFTERMALELGGAYAFSHATGVVSASGTGGAISASGDEHAYVTLGTAKLMFALLEPSNGAQLRLGVGPAVIHRGGTAYQADSDGTSIAGRTDLGGALSLCTRLPIRGALSLRVRAEDYVYNARLGLRGGDGTSDVDFPRRFQNDFLLSLGLQIGLSR